MSRLPILLLFFAALAAAAEQKPLAFGPVRFEKNLGQADAGVEFLARARGQQVFLTNNGAVFSPRAGKPAVMQFAGAGACHWEPAGSATDSISYFLGNDPAKWVRMAPMFDRVVWHDAWPGIDVAFHGDGDLLEYDLVLAPHADASKIRIQFKDPARLRFTADGSLEIAWEGNVMRQRVPQIWQETPEGRRRKIHGRFVADGRNGVRLALSDYQRTKTLVVDPVLDMATYVGGENDDEIVSVIDGAVAGNTRSVAFPAPAFRSSRDVFIRNTGTRVPNPNSPSSLLFGTIVIGGSGDESVAGVAVGANPYPTVFVAGTTNSPDFPTAGSVSRQYKGGASDGFFAAINISQSYSYVSTSYYVGGSGEDRITSFTGSGNILAFAGVSDSPDLRNAAGVPQPNLAGGKDAFYGVISAQFLNLICGYLGGSGDDAAYAVAIRNDSSVWIGGQTSSTDFGFASGSISGPSDAFLAEVSTTDSFLFSTAPVTVRAWQIGGNGEDAIRALAVPSSTDNITSGSYLYKLFNVDGVAFGGVTTSSDLPVLNAAQPHPGGGADGFVGIWDRTTAAPRWLTYLGGSGRDEVTAVAQTWAGELYVGGWTESSDLPVVNALQPATAGGQDGLFAAYDYSGALKHLTYFGGSGDDRIQDVAVLANFDARVVGSSTSADLPQRQASQDRGGQMDGFMADIGSDFFLGPNSLVLAKDGQLPFSIRPARNMYRTPVTYQSADPTRVRLVYLGRSFDQVTAAPEDNITAEGLADNGEADILITAPGFTPKTVHVKLYPGAFVSPFYTSATISTWSGAYLAASYCPIDPGGGTAPGPCMTVRNGAPAPAIHWSISDPSIFQISDTGQPYPQLQPLQPGTATLTLAVDGYSVLQSTQTITAAAPRLVPPANDVHLGRDLSTTLPIAFTFNNAFVYTGYKGTLTARSSDPNRLLLSPDANQPGLAQVSAAMPGRLPAIWAQALADDGPVQVFLSMTGMDGEIPFNLVLEPAVLRWGSPQYNNASGQTAFSPSLSLSTDTQGQQVWLVPQGISGASGQLRPGASPATLTMSNSNPQVVELNRLTVIMGSNSAYKLTGLAPGSSTLTLTSSNPSMPAVPDSLPVSVQASVPTLPAFSSSYYVGNGLQIPVTFSYRPTSDVNVTVTVDDPSLALLSSSLSSRGADQVKLQARPTDAQSTFYVQGLTSSGSTNIHVRFPEGERIFSVNLLPSAAGFTSSVALSEARIVAYALDRSTGIGVLQQTPQPGPGMTVHFSADEPVKLDKTSAVLTADAPEISLKFTPPPPGQQATIRVTTDGNSSVSPLTSSLKARTVAPSGPATVASIVLARGALGQVSLNGVGFPATATSSDPQNVLVSANAADAGAPSVQLRPGTTTLYLHALGDSGSFSVTLDSPGAVSSIVQVALAPLQFNFNAYTSVPLNATVDMPASLNANTLRPGVGPFHFTAQTADPSIATVTPAAFDVGGAATFAGKLNVTGVSTGTTQLKVTGPPDVYVVPPAATVNVPAMSATTAAPPYALGVNLQASTQIDLGASFTNPNGAIVTLSSSNPDVLLLSRSAAAVGTASVVVAVPAGQHLTQTIYLQGLAAGSATIQLTTGGSTAALAAVSITRSWVSCYTGRVSLIAGATQIINCGLRFDAPQTFAQVSDIGPRPGLTDVTLSLSSSATDVLTVSPGSLALSANSVTVTLRGVAPGQAILKLTPPAAFGPSPDGSDTVMVTVTPPVLYTACSNEQVLGIDTQLTCPISPVAAIVTATSSDPGLLRVSSDPSAPGGPTAAIPANTQNGSITLQALAAYGTVEVVVSAPGYQDVRIPVALRGSQIKLSVPTYPPPPFTLKIGSSVGLTVSMATGPVASTPRAGANIAVDLTTDPAGIVSINPAHLVLSTPNSTGNVQVNALAAGSTLLRISVPAAYSASGTPLAVTVVP